MGSKLLKFVAYVALFVVSFVFFLYWFFPYDVLKDRITSSVEKQIGAGLEIQIEGLKPYWFTGVDIRGAYITEPGRDKSSALVEFKRVIARASIFSLIFGRPNVSFDIEIGKGEISGSFRQTDEILDVRADIDDLDLGAVKIVFERLGLKLTSRIGGHVELKIDRQRAIRSSGKITLAPVDFRISQSEFKLNDLSLPLPDLVLSRGRESNIKLDIGKGAVTIESFKLAGEDLNLDLTGKIFLASTIDNCRLNLSGLFTLQKKLSDALPFLFIVEQQKQPDGSYPLTLTGRLAKPAMKIGAFTVPM